jgi:hypothetical protein
MLHLSDLLAAIPLPKAEIPEPVPAAPAPCPRSGEAATPVGDATLVHDLGADLPAGHLHVWGGPPGAGKTSFLLGLLHGASQRGRRVVYATYDLPAETLAMRMLAMVAGVDVDDLPDPGGAESAGGLSPQRLACVLHARERLSTLPFDFLPARGFSTDSLADRLVRMPFRPEVLAVDYLQGVIREPGTDMGVALRSLSDMAEHLHVAVICTVRGAGDGEGVRESASLADRVGWIGAGVPEEPGVHRAEVISNRYGGKPKATLRIDDASRAVRGQGEQRSSP